MGLREYQRKRDSRRTPEPAAKLKKTPGQRYVIQKHAASHLHYDFRLELDGVLKSWAVPKGPSLDPKVRRLAMHVEDHPVEYGDFEGIIPQGEYGGGTVMLWDQGTWEPVGDARDGYRRGKLKFRLHGEKLRGAWMLIKWSRSNSGKNNEWFLFKERDAEARSGDGHDIVTEQPLSVVSDRDLEAIAADQGQVWSSKPRRGRAKTNGKPLPKRSLKSCPGANGVKKRASRATASAMKKLFANVRLTSPDKILYEESGITKRELADYYFEVADWILPHVANRPISLVRCPEGAGKTCFFQKHPGAGMSETIRQVPVKEKSKTRNYLVVDKVEDLVSFAQMGALEIHVWGSRADKLEYPDRMIFDLDPDSAVPWSRVVESAHQIRVFLEDVGLRSFVKTTGGKGLHIVVPLQRKHDWDEVKAFSKWVAELIERAQPRHYTSNMSKALRRGKIFVDYLRNARSATAIVAYSTRARAGATVSVPLSWDELTPEIHSDTFTIRNLLERLHSLKKDPWAEIGSVRQSLTAKIKKKLGFTTS